MSVPPIETLADLIAVSLAAERNALRAYHALAHNMEQYGNTELATLFRRLADEEGEHAAEVERLARQQGVSVEQEVPQPMWDDAAESFVDRDEARRPATSTPYKALAYAVQNEERAFRFYSYVAATAADENMRRYAEAFAQEELAHAALLRAQRRNAYHEQNEKGSSARFPDPGSIRSLPDLLYTAVKIARHLAAQLAAIAETHEGLQELITDARGAVTRLEEEMAESGPVSGEIVSTVDKLLDDEAFAAEAPPLRGVLAALDRAFAFYDGVVQITRDEAVGLKAQALTRETLDQTTTLLSLDGFRYQEG